jgi:hypothetical protein
MVSSSFRFSFSNSGGCPEISELRERNATTYGNVFLIGSGMKGYKCLGKIDRETKTKI